MSEDDCNVPEMLPWLIKEDINLKKCDFSESELCKLKDIEYITKDDKRKMTTKFKKIFYTKAKEEFGTSNVRYSSNLNNLMVQIF